MTVYRFAKDAVWPMKTACTGDWLKNWPVVAPMAKNAVDGVTKKGCVTYDRPAGVEQRTIDCRPNHTFAGDAKPGDNNGQGIGGTWYAVPPIPNSSALPGNGSRSNTAQEPQVAPNRRETASGVPVRRCTHTRSDGPAADATGV